MTAPALYIPHGGGPLPLLDDPGHRDLVQFIKRCPDLIEPPRAILVVSAHWEAPVCTVQSGAHPALLFDYSGFPRETYQLDYPAPGSPDLAERVVALLRDAGIEAMCDAQRGFDHGLFVPLLLMYPGAEIPCLQLSLLDSMNAQDHIDLGRALTGLREDGVMILGSGSPFHNMNAFRDGPDSHRRCAAFDDWLVDSCCNSTVAETASRLAHWADAPEARYAHPREEHLLPLHVCFGAAMAGNKPAEQVFDGDMMGYRMSAFLWR